MPINQVCAADDKVSDDMHKHQCEKCGTCFKHANDVADATIEEFDEAHTCPACGEGEQTLKLMTFDEKQKAMDALFARLFGGF